MTLREKFIEQGNWLFRRRGYLPFLLFPLFVVAIKDAGKTSSIYELICVLVSFIGLGIRCFTVGFVPKGTSGRNTKEQVAEKLNTTGMYSLMRHPLYFANFITFLGILMFVGKFWLVLTGILLYALYYERIMLAEEEFLREKFGELFISYAKETPAFFPNFRKWKPPELPFSPKSVIRREYTTLFLLTSLFTGLKVLKTYLNTGKFDIELGWKIFFAFGLISYIILRFLKKRTSILKVDDR